MKKAIALAIAAALAAPLAAQAEVKVSGQLQAEITSWGGDGANGITMNDAQEGTTPDSGNWGALNFTASEDLGNGMKAIAKVGMNVNATNGNANGNRDSYVGLSGNFGTVLAGTLSTPYKMATVKWDPFLATSAQARGNLGSSTLHNGYQSNALAYANKFGNAKVVAAIVFDESDDGTGDYNNENAISASLNMPVGPVEVALGYINSELADAGATKVGVKYAAGAMSVALVYENLEAGAGALQTGGAQGYNGNDQTFLTVHGTYTVGANTFALNYGMNTVDDAVESDNTNMSIGMVHSFSKSTSAHVAYTAITDDLGDADYSGIAAGLRVKF